jgi:hypothetical protein
MIWKNNAGGYQCAANCMYYIEAIDGHCDCVNAPKDAEIIVED